MVMKTGGTNSEVGINAHKSRKEATYDVFSDGAFLEKGDSRKVFGCTHELKIVKHTATVQVRYLVEFPDGTRQWRSEEVQRKQAKRQSTWDDEDKDADDEDEDEESFP